MNIITLTEIQFKNYSRIHSKRNYLQSIEYANLEKEKGYTPQYIGMIDDNNNLVAASLILSKKIIGKYYFGYIPGGYLIDYNNYDLLNNFTNLLKDYLNKLNYVYVSITPLATIKITNKMKNVIYNNDNIISNLEKLGYKKSKKSSITTNLCLKTNGNTKKTYDNFSRFVKRNIRENELKGITVYKGEEKDLDVFYKLIQKKTNYDKKYYSDFFKYFDNENNKFEIYFAHLDTSVYLKNYNTLLNKEKTTNDNLSKKILDINIKNKDYLINKKIASDKLIEKYNTEIKKAILLNNLYKDGIIAACVAIIKTNNKINFLVEGYEEKIRDIRASYSIKWEIIKEYSKQGYTLFNLGYIPNNNNNKEPTNKFNGIFLSRLGFNADIYDFPETYNLIINNSFYTLINFIEPK